MPLVETNCGPVEYVEAGAGAPILYFHGTGVTGDAMLPVESPLVDDGFRLIVPNRPGYGGTPLASNRSAEACGHVAAALLDVLGIDTVAVMGSSGGALFATSFAVHHGERTDSLVLLCPQLHRWNHRRWLPASSRWTLPFLKLTILRRPLLALYRMQLPRMGVDRFLEMEAGDAIADVAEDVAAHELCRTTLAAMTTGTRCPGFENDFVVFTREDVLSEGRTVRCPTLVVHDGRDPMAPVEHVDWFASQVPHCERLPVRAGGHLVWVGPEAARAHEARVRFLRATLSARA